jgi:hypothetical protein
LVVLVRFVCDVDVVDDEEDEAGAHIIPLEESRVELPADELDVVEIIEELDNSDMLVGLDGDIRFAIFKQLLVDDCTAGCSIVFKLTALDELDEVDETRVCDLSLSSKPLEPVVEEVAEGGAATDCCCC